MLIKVYIFHYHLLPGGVTDVIISWIRLIEKQIEQIFPEISAEKEKKADRESFLELHICSGSKYDTQNPEWVLPPNTGAYRLYFHLDPCLAYHINPSEPTDRPKDAEVLAEHLVRTYGSEGSLWWVHNYHVGKNPSLTGAFLQIAQNSQQRMLWQIHDFPECGRPDNYRALQALVAPQQALPSLYPLRQNVVYAVVNRRDYQILRAAGFAETHLFLLPNPLPFPSALQKNHSPASPPAGLKGSFARREDLCSALMGQAQPHRSHWQKGAPILLYPVRCIRRKNILEAGLLNLLAGDPANLVVTLPGCSEAEIAYSQLVEQAFAQGLLQGLCGVGPGLEAQGWDLGDLYSAADLVISTSVMEGFGFTYFHPMRWARPLLARYLDVLHGFSDCFPSEVCAFYRELRIPLAGQGASSWAKGLYEAFQLRFARYLAQLPQAIREPAARAIHSIVHSTMDGQESAPVAMDFAHFPVDQQWAIIQRARSDGAYRSLLADENQQILKDFRRLLALRVSASCIPEENWETLQGGQGRQGGQGDLGGRDGIDGVCGAEDAEKKQEIRAQKTDLTSAFCLAQKAMERELGAQHLGAVLRQIWLAYDTPCKRNQGTSPEYPPQMREQRVLAAFSFIHHHLPLFWDREWESIRKTL